MLKLALSKGRLLEDLLPLLKAAGLAPTVSPDDTRQLILPSTMAGLNFLILRATDVLTFVRHGAAQMGICGRDMLLEQEASDVFQPFDLPIGHCRLSLALPINRAKEWKKGAANSHFFPLRLATKYPLVTQNWFAQRQQSVHLIKLYGSMEIAPAMGLADGIVDLVSSGATLRDNHLAEVEVLESINARLIVNRSAMKTQYAALQPILSVFEQLAQAR